MSRNEWEGREEATKDGRQGNPEIGEKEGTLTKDQPFRDYQSRRHLSFWKSSYPKSRPCVKNPSCRRVCNHNKMRRISVVFGSEEGRKGGE
jgi:hypothetical protein